MKTLKLSFDLTDQPQLVEALRLEAARSSTSQKAILVSALEAYFSNRLENSFLASAAHRSFTEWDNSEDSIYDTL